MSHGVQQHLSTENPLSIIRNAYTDAHVSLILNKVSGSWNLANMKGGDAVSTGLGLGLGLSLTSYMFQAMKTSEKTAKPLIVCLKCHGGNALDNKFCWHCGSALYPPSPAQCSKCKAAVPAMKYCGNCGSKLKKQKQKEKREDIPRLS